MSNNESNEKKLLSITEAAKLNNVSRQAIYIQIQKGGLVAQKKTTRWMIDVEALENYKKNKYCRSKSTFNGELLFDNTRGLFSVNQVAKILKVPAQKIYYAVRSGLLKAQQKGAAWVIEEKDIENYREKNLNKKDNASEKAVG